MLWSWERDMVYMVGGTYDDFEMSWSWMKGRGLTLRWKGMLF